MKVEARGFPPPPRTVGLVAEKIRISVKQQIPLEFLKARPKVVPGISTSPRFTQCQKALLSFGSDQDLTISWGILWDSEDNEVPFLV